MTTRYQHPHLKIEIILPIEDGLISKGQTIQLQDLKEALDTLTSKINIRKEGI